MKIRYPEIIRDKATVETLEVQSFEMNIYLVNVSINGVSGMLYDDKDNLYRFHSTQAIRDAFDGIEVIQAVMVHESPYDEMIGNPPKAEESMRVPFSMSQPY